MKAIKNIKAWLKNPDIKGVAPPPQRKNISEMLNIKRPTSVSAISVFALLMSIMAIWAVNAQLPETEEIMPQESPDISDLQDISDLPDIPELIERLMPIPYYMCYKIDRKVNLRTQFGMEKDVDVEEEGKFLCAPALLDPAGSESEQKKNLAQLERRYPHLKFYGINAPAIKVPKILISKEFGNESVIVTKPSFLGLPVKKAFPPRYPGMQLANPHYKCYEIEPSNSVDRWKNFRTQFSPWTERIFVTQSRFLCAPALKNPVGDEAVQRKGLEQLEKKFPHLKLYAVRPDQRMIPLNLRTQFGTELKINIAESLYLAVPVRKENACTGTNITLNTGFDQTSGMLIPIGGKDDDWNVTADPFPNTIEPRPADVVVYADRWPAPFPGTQWISFDPSRGYGMNINNKDFRYQYNFTLPACFSNANLSMNIRPDNIGWVYLNGNFINQTLEYPAISYINTSNQIFFKAGENNLTVVVRDLPPYQVITGLNLKGTVTAN